MEIFIVAIVALLASALTLFSRFGLGMLLMPVVAIYFPVEIAIAIAAMVYFANNACLQTRTGVPLLQRWYLGKPSGHFP